jgi:hypothetical protein
MRVTRVALTATMKGERMRIKENDVRGVETSQGLFLPGTMIL